MDIHVAAENGDWSAIRSALKKQPNLLDKKSSLGDTALHCAIYQRQVKVAKELINLNANLEVRGDRGRTPLHATAVSGSVEIARILLKHGVEIEAIDERGQTPLQLAVSHVETGRPETQRLVQLLIKSGASYDIESAVMQGDAERVKAVLTSAPNTIKKMHNDQQAKLFHAALDSARITDLLLKAGPRSVRAAIPATNATAVSNSTATTVPSATPATW